MKNDGCEGYSSFNGESTEYECEYEFADDCGDCMFGNQGGKTDPRVDPRKEDDCPQCKHDEVCTGGCESELSEYSTYKFEKKEENA